MTQYSLGLRSLKIILRIAPLVFFFGALFLFTFSARAQTPLCYTHWSDSGLRNVVQLCPSLESIMSISVVPPGGISLNDLAIGDTVGIRWNFDSSVRQMLDTSPGFVESCSLSFDVPAAAAKLNPREEKHGSMNLEVRPGKYSLTLECAGVLDNQQSDETGTARKTLSFEVAPAARMCIEQGFHDMRSNYFSFGSRGSQECHDMMNAHIRGGALVPIRTPDGSVFDLVHQVANITHDRRGRWHCNFHGYFRAPVLAPGARSQGLLFCPALNEVVQFSSDKTSMNEGESFSISWSAPFALECTLSGKHPETKELFSETFNGTRRGSYIRGSETYGRMVRIEEGIYPFTLSCRGYLDNRTTDRVGTIERRVTVSVGDIPPPPNVVVFTIEPEEIKRGEKATLRWRVESATAISINQRIGVVRAEGSREVSPTVTTQYSITASGRFPELGLSRKSVVLRVTAPDRPDVSLPPAVIEEGPPTEFEFPEVEEEDTTNLKVNGQDGPLTMRAPASFTLSWNLDRYCVKHGSWLGIVRKAGSERVTVTRPGTYTYKMYCPLAGSDEVVVRVVGGEGGVSVEPLPVAEASVSVDGAAFSRSVRVIRGEPVNLFLSAAVDVNGDGLASRDETDQWTGLLSFGGRCEWNTDLNRGEPTFDGAVSDPQNPNECSINLGNMTFFDEPGVYRIGVLRLVQNDGKVSNTSYVNIAVHDPPPPEGPPEIVFTINGVQTPEMVLGAPAQYSLGWSARNATSCVASGDWSGDRFPAGIQSFVASEKREFSYTITCTGELGVASETIFLKVAELPVCDFTALPTVIDGRAVFVRQSELSWTCEFANTCAIAPGVGSVNTFGLVRVSPLTTTNYVLTCQNLDGESSFEQRVEVR